MSSNSVKRVMAVFMKALDNPHFREQAGRKLLQRKITDSTQSLGKECEAPQSS